LLLLFLLFLLIDPDRQWIVQGYSTMLHEIDEQLGDQQADLVVVPVGVGSFAQAVVSHYKSPTRHSRVLAVEPDTAACLYTSLTKGDPVTIETTTTIMTGLDCGTVSSIAWPVLQAGIDASLTVSDLEAHEACRSLHSMGVSSGPCGSSPLAALRRLSNEEKLALGLNQMSVVVLLSTEGPREYQEPRKVSLNDL
jgi:threonine dehydratase